MFVEMMPSSGGGGTKTITKTQAMPANGGTYNITVSELSEIYAIYSEDIDTSSNNSRCYAYTNSDGTYNYVSTSTYFNISNISGNQFTYYKGAWGIASNVTFKIIGN